MDLERLKKSIIAHEGLVYKAYQLEYKTAGGKKVKEDFYTVGVGHKITRDEEARLVGRELTNEEVMILLDNDIKEAMIDAKRFIDPNTILPQAFEIIVEMAFQLGGPNLFKFKKLRKALQENDYVEASEQMIDSAWRNQTPNRADKMALIMRDL